MPDDAAADFVCELPLWTIIDVQLLRAEGLPGAVSVMHSPRFGPLLALFTDEDLAIRFIGQAELTGRAPSKIDDRRALSTLLNQFEYIGVKYVGIDCPTLANQRNENGRYPTIRQVIAAVGRDPA